MPTMISEVYFRSYFQAILIFDTKFHTINHLVNISRFIGFGFAFKKDILHGYENEILNSDLEYYHGFYYFLV